MADRDLNDRTNASTAGFGTAGAAGASLRRLSELGDYEVADGHPDIRGWTVRTPDGQVLGKVDDLIVSVSEMRVRYLDVDVDRSVRSAIADAATPKGAEPGHALVPIGTARLDDGADGVVVNGLSGANLSSYPMYERQQGISREYEQALRGHLGAGTTGTEQADEFYAHEQYDDSQLFSGRRDRTGDSRMAAGTSSSDRAKGIPLSQEEGVVGKRPGATEQIFARKHPSAEHQTGHADLKDGSRDSRI